MKRPLLTTLLLISISACIVSNSVVSLKFQQNKTLGMTKSFNSNAKDWETAKMQDPKIQSIGIVLYKCEYEFVFYAVFISSNTASFSQCWFTRITNSLSCLYKLTIHTNSAHQKSENEDICFK